MRYLNPTKFDMIYDILNHYISNFLDISNYFELKSEDQRKVFLNLIQHLGLQDPNRYIGLKDCMVNDIAKFIFIIIFSHYNDEPSIYEFYNGLKVLIKDHLKLANIRNEVNLVFISFEESENMSSISWDEYLKMHPDIDWDLNCGKIFGEDY